MLNTLYPPVNSVQPTAQLTKEVLTTQRNGFFRYIQGVEKKGAKVLKALIEQGKSDSHETGWTNVRETVDRYLRSANAIIDECYDTLGRESLTSPKSPIPEKEAKEQRSKKTDSGISFTSSNWSSANRTSTSTTSSAKSKDRARMSPTNEDTNMEKPAGSTLERIAREIRKIRSRGDIKDAARQERIREKSRTRSSEAESPVTEVHHPPMPEQKERKLRLKPSLRKMRSVSALGERDQNITSTSRSLTTSPDQQDFDVEDMRRRRMLWEARNHPQGLHRRNESFESMEVDV